MALEMITAKFRFRHSVFTTIDAQCGAS